MSAPSWLTGKADAASLASLAELLITRVEVTDIDEVWLFPTRRVLGVDSTVFVFSLYEHDDQRRVITAHMRTTRNKRGEPTIETRLDEQATLPVERIPRVIEGVLKRLTDDYATPPSNARIDRSHDRWRELVEVLMSIKANDALPENLLPNAEEPNDVDD